MAANKIPHRRVKASWQIVWFGFLQHWVFSNAKHWTQALAESEQHLWNYSRAKEEFRWPDTALSNALRVGCGGLCSPKGNSSSGAAWHLQQLKPVEQQCCPASVRNEARWDPPLTAGKLRFPEPSPWLLLTYLSSSCTTPTFAWDPTEHSKAEEDDSYCVSSLTP